jgi:hypothetical protein
MGDRWRVLGVLLAISLAVTGCSSSSKPHVHSATQTPSLRASRTPIARSDSALGSARYRVIRTALSSGLLLDNGLRPQWVRRFRTGCLAVPRAPAGSLLGAFRGFCLSEVATFGAYTARANCWKSAPVVAASLAGHPLTASHLTMLCEARTDDQEARANDDFAAVSTTFNRVIDRTVSAQGCRHALGVHPSELRFYGRVSPALRQLADAERRATSPGLEAADARLGRVDETGHVRDNHTQLKQFEVSCG